MTEHITLKSAIRAFENGNKRVADTIDQLRVQKRNIEKKLVELEREMEARRTTLNGLVMLDMCMPANETITICAP